MSGAIILDLTFLSFIAAAVAYGWLALALLRPPRTQPSSAALSWAAPRLFVSATVAAVAWASLGALDRFSQTVTPAYGAQALDVLRQALWCVFILKLLRPVGAQTGRGTSAYWLHWVLLCITLWATWAWAQGVYLGQYEISTSSPALSASLAFAVLGLVLVEQLYRNLSEDSRWGAKPLCLGLGLVFAYDLYLFSEAVLLGHLDPDAASVRGVVGALSVPLLWLAARGRSDWMRRLQLSRSVAFHSATLVLVGTYLLFMAAVGYYVRYFGGEWGRALQLALLAAGVLALGAMVLSGSLRARVRVFVGKNFFSYRYDYREEWLRFTRLLASNHAPQEVGTLVVRGLANLVECPGGDLWLAQGRGADFKQTARWNLAQVADAEPATSSFSSYLVHEGWVIDLQEYRDSPRRYADLQLPKWLLGRADAWLVVPLSVAEELMGFVTLARPRTPIELNWEVRDLLKTAAQQAAGYLAQMQATEALLEARKFDAFNRMSAFVVHDLKNIVTQLSLMLKNAQRLHDNPEFQQDMLLTVESSLEKMRRLMLQLREGATPPGSAHGVELESVLRRLIDLARVSNRVVEIDCEAGLATRGHPERLERVLGHMVQNALDATPATGRVWVTARRLSGQVQVEVGDTGKGMDKSFVENQLFRPFNSTKHSGMGIGAYESHQYITELGGSIAVQSEPGVGTVIRLNLPLFVSGTEPDARHGAV